MPRKRATVSVCGQTVVDDDTGHKCRGIDGCKPCEREIRQRAYEISLARRGVPHDPQSDWLQAETELLGRRILGLT